MALVNKKENKIKKLQEKKAVQRNELVSLHK
jgi:hypothetical protein